MTRTNNPFQILTIIVCAALLLLPALLTTLAWGGSLNIEVAATAIAVTIAAAIWLPKLRWLLACITAILIAIPPFPYWTNWDTSRGQYLHFFYGFTLNSELVTRFSVVFAAAMFLFAVIFWSLASSKGATSS